MKQDNDSNGGSGDGQSAGKSEDTVGSNILSDIEQDAFDHQQDVPIPGQVRRNKSLLTTSSPLPRKWSHANTDIKLPLVPNS
jgi:hypothetical protein